MLEHFYAVIMAGGGGTRLWPLSRQTQPKQMLNLFGTGTLFQTSVNRLDGIFPPERIFVVTIQDQVTQLQSQCPEIPERNFIIEPFPRGTASVVGLAAVVLQKLDHQAIMAVLTADHFIGEEILFRQLLISAYKVVEKDYLVTLGIEPTFPSTGFGYIQFGEKIEETNNIEAFKVSKFKEKPDEANAKAFIEHGDHVWNSGMFFWKVKEIRNEIERLMPDLAAGIEEVSVDWGTPHQEATLNRVWDGLESQTIDYGVMERAKNVAVIPAARLNWNDVGSWESLFDVVDPDSDGNIVIGNNHLGLDTTRSLIYAEKEGRLIVTIGINNLVLVDTGDFVLVCSRDDAQKVKQIVELLPKDVNSQE